VLPTTAHTSEREKKKRKISIKGIDGKFYRVQKHPFIPCFPIP